uniref:Uncharacterized protein n=1 Tax=Anguilla anguilla TaxID=7936 RepID=A0A0E9X579_ANGAN
MSYVHMQKLPESSASLFVFTQCSNGSFCLSTLGSGLVSLYATASFTHLACSSLDTSGYKSTPLLSIHFF